MTHLKIAAVIGLATFLASHAFAAGAVSYSCVGKNNVNGEAVVFDLLFADYAQGAGYTNQSITITKKGYERLEKPLVLQMFDATKKNNCKTNSEGEIYMAGGFEMLPTAKDDLAPYRVNFKSECSEDQKFDVNAECFFEN